MGPLASFLGGLVVTDLKARPPIREEPLRTTRMSGSESGETGSQVTVEHDTLNDPTLVLLDNPTLHESAAQLDTVPMVATADLLAWRSIAELIAVVIRSAAAPVVRV